MFGRQNRTRMIITGALIGSATGSILTFLLTPKTGKELRTDIMDNVDTSLTKIKDTTEKFYSKVKDSTVTTVNRVQSALSAGVNSYKTESQHIKTSKEILEDTLKEGGNNTHANI
ncbi:MAG: YtxH domain-containing protein [Clostridiales bacterium]